MGVPNQAVGHQVIGQAGRQEDEEKLSHDSGWFRRLIQDTYKLYRKSQGSLIYGCPKSGCARRYTGLDPVSIGFLLSQEW